MIPQRALPPYRNWKAAPMQLSQQMREARERALKDQPELIAMTTSVQYSKVLVK